MDTVIASARSISRYSFSDCDGEEENHWGPEKKWNQKS